MTPSEEAAVFVSVGPMLVVMLAAFVVGIVELVRHALRWRRKRARGRGGLPMARVRPSRGRR